MAAMKARRPRQHAEKPRRRRGPVAPQTHATRLTAIQSAWAGEPQPVSPRSVIKGLVGMVLFAGAAIAGATWIGGSLFDAQEAFERSADGVAANVGFAMNAETVEIEGVRGARADEVREMINPDGWRSLLALDPQDVLARVQSLDWVESARVTRLWPSTLKIDVTRREAFARWQEDGEVAVIDVNGVRLVTENAADHPNLPLVVGANAGPNAGTLLLALEEAPQVRERLKALVRVNDRRWNVELNTGTTVRLPEAAPGVALTRLEGLQRTHMLLDRPVAELDMRLPGRLAVRVAPAHSRIPALDEPLLAGGA